MDTVLTEPVLDRHRRRSRSSSRAAGRSAARSAPTGNKNAALPIIAACLLTDEPVVAPERPAHPRRRDDARPRRGPRRRRRAARRRASWRIHAAARRRSTSSTRSCAAASAPRSCSPARSSRAAAEADRPAARRRRRSAGAASTRTCTRFERLGATVAIDRGYRNARHRRAARRLDLPRRGVRDRHRERDHGRRPRARATTVIAQRGLRAARPGPLPLPRLARRARSTASARTSSASRASSGCTVASTDLPGPHRGRRASSASPPSPTARSSSRTSAPTISAPSGRASSASACAARSRTRPCAFRAGQELAVRDDLGAQIPKIEDGPWPHFPADLTSIALAVATQARGDDPDLREDVREPAVLRGQARHDGRADHPLRPAPRGRDRAGAALRRAHGEPRHPRGDGDADREPLRRGHGR